MMLFLMALNFLPLCKNRDDDSLIFAPLFIRTTFLYIIVHVVRLKEHPALGRESPELNYSTGPVAQLNRATAF